MSSNTELDLKKLMGEDIISQTSDAALDALLTSMENFSNTTTVKGTGNIFDCAISLGDLDFDINLDFFNLEPSRMDYILLKKIAYLRRLIVDINNIFIGIIQDLECCTGDDRYNRTVVPIFKWLVEDENGLGGTLLRIAKDINKIYLPLKRILCLFRNVPGNPTIGTAGTDYLKYIYPITDGLEKIMNLLDNGRFLDILIIPVKDFHDKLIACSNGKDTDFYTNYSSIKDIISTSIYDELTMNLIDEIKRQQNPDIIKKEDYPTPPTPPNLDGYSEAPNLLSYPNYTEYSKAMYTWNQGFSEFRKEKERKYNDEYSQYLMDLSNYRKTRFESTLTLNNEKFENNSFAVEIMVDDYKNKHRAICGCLGEIFRLDGYFVPSDYIIRSSADLNGLIGEVEYKGVSSRNYYMDNDEKKIKIINSSMLGDISTRPVETTFEELMKYPFVKDKYLDRISKTKTIRDVIDLNNELTKEKIILTQEFRKYSNYYDSLNSSFYSIYLNEIESFRKTIAYYKVNPKDITKYEEANKGLYNYASYPPANWVTYDKSLTMEYQRIFGNITYKQYLKGVNDLKEKQKAIEELEEAIGRNHTVLKIVDNTKLECGCDLLCMVIKYIINLILSIIKKLILYITKAITNSIMNKELQWWIKFVTEKIRCIIDILNLSEDLERMEKAFQQEMDAAKNSIQKAPESVANCSASTTSIIDELNLYPDKAKVEPDTIEDITWVPDIYPGGIVNTDVTPNFDNSFKLITDQITYEKTNWKNRTIPTMVLDCSKDFHAKVDWVPQSGIWKAFLNVELNINQFESSPDILLQGNPSLTDSEIVQNLYTGILYKLLDSAVKQESFIFKINSFTENIFNTNNLIYTLTDSYVILNGVNILFQDITSVFFYVEEIKEYVKVYDRLQDDTLRSFQETIKAQLLESLDKLKTNTFEIDEVEQTSNKYCSPTSLRVKIFEPVYKDKTSPLFPGEVIFTEDEYKTFIYSALEIIDPINNTSSKLIKDNIPFKIVLENGSGQEFIVIALIDVCHPSLVQKRSYDKNIDGVFLGGRYDYFEFDAIPNNIDYVISEKEIIKKLKNYLEGIGAISSTFTGPLGSLNIQEESQNLIDNTVEETIQLLDLEIEQNENLANDVLNNLPNGPFKNSIYLMEKLVENIEEAINEVEEAKNLSEEFNIGITDFNIIPEGINKSDARLGIPLLTLNEEENIILTIHKKKLKLININSNFGLNSILETVEIDYQEGEQLFIEYSTNGFEHKISWLNERKMSASATVVSMNTISLKPTQLGSYYKDNTKIALLCGKIHDIIFTESSRDRDEWFNNSNTYRPSGTIGYYDFSVFDGYHVYSIPEFFKVIKLNSVANIKGILYESKEYSREEIQQKIQNGNFNEILSKEVTVVGERPISVGGDFIWSNKKYYKNVSFGYLENFFCRDNLAGDSFTISFWLKMKDAKTNNRIDYKRKYIFSDTHNGNFIWLEDNLLHIQLFGQFLRTEPVNLLFIKDLLVLEPEYVEKWFHHVFRYDKKTSTVYYSLKAIDQKRNFDPNYELNVLDDINIIIPLKNSQVKKLNFSLVTMLARFDVEKLDYTDHFWGEIAALAIWKEFKNDDKLSSLYNYQKRIIINEME